MTPKVPMSESGTATLGMMVAQTFRRNAKTTKITRMMEMMSATSTSWTDAQMQRGRNGSAEYREKGGDAVHRLDHVGAGLAKNGQKHCALSACESQVARVFDGIDNLCDLAQAYRSAYASGNDQRLIFVRLENLVGVGDGPRLLGIGQSTLREVCVGRLERL